MFLQRIIKETFALDDVPREALYFGMAGVVPYVATSLSTIYLAWDINHAAATGEGFLLSGQTAELLLHILEPLQIGYGAVVSSRLVVRLISLLTGLLRLSHFSVPYIGDSNGQNMVAPRGTADTGWASSPLLLLGQRPYSPSNTH